MSANSSAWEDGDITWVPSVNIDLEGHPCDNVEKVTVST